MSKTKSKFEYMSTNEWCGDATTHFMKSGEVFRSDDNDELHEIVKLIPKSANGVKVEYDITYDVYPIAGYKYTDFLTKAFYIAPNNHKISLKNIAETASLGPTEDGHRVAELLKKNLTDKYFLDNDEDEYKCDELVILPGTNILMKEDVIDFEKIDGLVKNGAMVKMHPITSKVWRALLVRRWGEENVIPADAPLYPTLKNAKKIYFSLSSETGISSTLLGKDLGLINKKKNNSNFEFIYNGIDRCPKRMRMYDKMVALFSHPQSGIFTVYHENIEERIEQYFEHMKRYQHK